MAVWNTPPLVLIPGHKEFARAEALHTIVFGRNKDVSSPHHMGGPTAQMIRERCCGNVCTTKKKRPCSAIASSPMFTM